MKKYFLAILPFAVILIMIAVWFSVAKAASLTTARDYLSRNQAELTEGVIHEIQFTPATALTGGTGANNLQLIFPDDEDEDWCVAAGDLTVSTSVLRVGATALSGASITASCTQGSGGSNYDTITIEGFENLDADSTYAVKVSDGTAGDLGTPAAGSSIITVKTNDGSDVDIGYVAVSIIASDQITITGTVDPTLTFAVGSTAVGFGTMTASDIRYATSSGTGSTAVQSAGEPVRLTVSTNADDGAVIEIKDEYDSMYSVGTGATIPAVASNLVVGGTPGYGVYGKDSSSLTIDAGFDDNGSGDVAISTTFQTFASSAAPVSSAYVDVQPKIGISGATPAGSYADTLTVIATGKF